MTTNRQHWSESSPQWWEPFPVPKSEALWIESGEVLRLLEQARREARQDFLLVDVRRADWEGGALATSINIPAHSFYQARPMLYNICKRANMKRIIIFCRSSSGRGPRCASWMRDYILEVGSREIDALVMKGGVKGWVNDYGGRLMDSYVEEHWTQLE